MEPQRILILGKLPPPLMGPAIATQIIMNSDLRHRYELKHFDTRINRSLSDMGRFKIAKFVSVARHYRQFRQVLNRFKPQLVLIPISQTSIGFAKDAAFIRMAKRSGACTLVQLRGSLFANWSKQLNGVSNKLLRRSLQDADGALVLGENLRSQFEDFLPSHQIYVVPNGGDFNFPPRRQTELRITYLANFLPGKGLKELLQALLILKNNRRIPDFEFHAYGAWDSDAYRKECTSLANQLPSVWLHPAISGDMKWQAFADTDIFVFAPRDPEGHPWSIIEAMAAGLPIISTDRGAISQSVIDKENGFLLADPNPSDLARALETLLLDRGLRIAMGAASRSLYETHFTAQKMVDRLDEVFKSAMEKISATA